MKLKKEYHYLAEILNKIHILVMVCYIVSTALIIFSPKYRIYAAIFIALASLVELPFRGECPITIEEKIMREKAGEKMDKKGFVHGFFKHYLHIKFPLILLNIYMIVISVISFIIILLTIFN